MKIDDIKFDASKYRNENIFDLYDNFLEDKENITILNKIKSIIENDSFNLASVKFSNYKRLDYLEFELDKTLNVIIGSNGVGKTTILNGIVKNISWLVNNILKHNNNGIHLSVEDISNNIKIKKTQTSISECKFTYGDHTEIQGELIKHQPGFTSKRQSKVSTYKNIGEIWRNFYADENMNLPLFSYYSVGRFHEKVNSKKSVDDLLLSKNFNKLDVYKNSLDGSIKFESFTNWLLSCLKIQLSSSDMNGYREKLEQVLSAKNSLLPGSQVYDLLSREEETLKAFIEKNDRNGFVSKQLRLINELVCKIYPDFKEFILKQDTGFDEIYLYFKSSDEINIKQLSDGERVFLGLLMDIAFKMIVLNTNLSNPFHGKGIIVIDEIELHLHPEWQQKSLLFLQESFPHLQLIITTHSPHVLSTVDKSQIKILTKGLEIYSPQLQTRGIISSDILERLMNTSAIPPVPESNKLLTLTKSIESGTYGDPESKEIYNELVEHFGLEHPEIIKINALINLIKLKQRFHNK